MLRSNVKSVSYVWTEKKFLGSSEEDEVFGFFVLSYLWMRGYFRLSKG